MRKSTVQWVLTQNRQHPVWFYQIRRMLFLDKDACETLAFKVYHFPGYLKSPLNPDFQAAFAKAITPSLCSINLLLPYHTFASDCGLTRMDVVLSFFFSASNLRLSQHRERLIHRAKNISGIAIHSQIALQVSGKFRAIRFSFLVK